MRRNFKDHCTSYLKGFKNSFFTAPSNQDEVEKFDNASGDWWDKDGEFKILHQINPLRSDFIKSTVIKHYSAINAKDIAGSSSLQPNIDFTNLHLLDVGCGGGILSAEMAASGFKVLGIDASVNAIKVAKNYANRNELKSLEYINTTIEDLHQVPLTERKIDKYDVIVCMELLEHLDDIESFLRHISNFLKDDGLLILSTINRNFKSFLLAIVCAEYILKLVKKNTHHYQKFIKPSELSRALLRSGLNLNILQGMEFNLLMNTWQITDNVNVNYIAAATKNIQYSF